MRYELDARDSNRLVDRLKREGYKSFGIGSEHKLKGLLVESVRILKLIGSPLGILLKACAELVFVDILCEESNRLIVYQCGDILGPYIRHFIYNVGSVRSVFRTSLDSKLCSLCKISVCALAFGHYKLTVAVDVLPRLGDSQITSLRKRNGAVYHKYSLNRSRLVLHRIVVNDNAVLSSSLDLIGAPGDRSRSGNVKTLAAFVFLNVSDRAGINTVFDGAVLIITCFAVRHNEVIFLGGVDNNFLTRLRCVKIVFEVRLVRGSVKQRSDIINTARGCSAISAGNADSTANQKHKSEYESCYPLKFRLSHCKIFLLLNFVLRRCRKDTQTPRHLLRSKR